MCTSIILYRKSDPWPIIIGSNRDEKLDRESIFPGRHWNQYPNIVAGKDLKKNGSWIGINDHGIVALIHNRISNKDLVEFNYSRGNIVLEILKYRYIDEAINYMSSLNCNDYNFFNLLIADYKNCYFIKHNHMKNNVKIHKVNEGFSVMTDKDINDKNDKKINFYHKLFSSSKPPNPSVNNWDSWKKNLSYDEDELLDNEKICFINKKFNYGTRSSSLIASSKSSCVAGSTNPCRVSSISIFLA